LNKSKPLFYRALTKLAWLLLSLRYNNNKNQQHPIKTTCTGSDITRTTRTEAQLTDFFEEDGFPEALAEQGFRSRAENNKTTFR
jgi:hypothetical protein